MSLLLLLVLVNALTAIESQKSNHTEIPATEPRAGASPPPTAKPKLHPSEGDPDALTCSLLSAYTSFQLDSVCLDEWRPAVVDGRVEWSSESCHFLERFYHSRRYRSASPLPPPAIPSPPAPAVGPHSGDGVMELVPIPCKPCDQDRKDRQFIRGVPFSSTMAKLLVDYASAQSGGKILAQSEGLRGASEILLADDNRYLLTLCSNKVWLTLRLSEEIFVEKLAFASSELFASTFRHIQVLGSRQYPTNEWRVLGEIETNPMETHEWFDVSASAQCSKCYVKFLKFRVLTHHALEGYTNCALTRVQVFGNTVLQSLDRIQSMNSSMSEVGTAQTPSFVKQGNRAAALVDARIRFLTGEPVPAPPTPEDSTPQEPPTTPPPPHVDDGNSPLLKFVEEMTQLKRQYNSVASSVFSMNEIIKSQAQLITVLQAAGGNMTLPAGSPTSPAASSIMLSVFGLSFVLPKLTLDWSTVTIILLIIAQVATIAAVNRSKPATVANPSYVVVSDPVIAGRRFSVRETTPFKKRSHGLWKPKAKRFLTLRDSVRSEVKLEDDSRVAESKRGSPSVSVRETPSPRDSRVPLDEWTPVLVREPVAN